MGLYWVINMGVPVLIGVGQQAASGGGGASSYSYSGLTSVTLSYGNQVGSGSTPIVTVPAGQQISTTLNAGNGYGYGPDTGAIFYEESDPNKRINLDIGFIADVSSLSASDLPTDGNCAITYTITPSIEFFTLRDFITGEVIAGSGPSVATSITITGLNRSQITDGSSTTFALPTLSNDAKAVRCTQGEDAPFGRGYDVDVTILMGDGSQLAPTNQGEARCIYASQAPPSFKENVV